MVLPDPQPGHRILLCMDRTASCESGVPHAVSLARTLDSSITLVHVLHPHRAHGPQPHDALGWEISRQEAQSYLSRLATEIESELGQPVDARLEQGVPSLRIVELARELGAEVTVLGGRAEDPDRAFGGTAEQVLALARNSVLIARTSADGCAPAAMQRVLVPLDGSRRAEAVLPVAARLARAHNAELLLVHIVQEPRPTALMELAGAMDLALRLAACLQDGARRYLMQLQQRLLREGTATRTLVLRHPNERQGLLQVTQWGKADLVVLSAHGATCDADRSFGSFIAHLLRSSTVPMLVLQDLPEREGLSADPPESGATTRWSRAAQAVDLA